jgi:hypothetical protein
LQESELRTSSSEVSFASNSSSADDDDGESLAELLTLSTAASAKMGTSSSNKEPKSHASAQGKQASGRTAAAAAAAAAAAEKARQPAAATAKALPDDFSQSFSRKPMAAAKGSTTGFSNKSIASGKRRAGWLFLSGFLKACKMCLYGRLQEVCFGVISNHSN